jgi:hypothetical protein
MTNIGFSFDKDRIEDLGSRNEVYIPVIDENIKGIPQRREVRTLGSLFSVDGLDGDSSNRLKPAVQEVMENPEVSGQVRVFRRYMKRQLLAVPFRNHDHPGSPVDPMGARNPRWLPAFETLQGNTVQGRRILDLDPINRLFGQVPLYIAEALGRDELRPGNTFEKIAGHNLPG